MRPLPLMILLLAAAASQVHAAEDRYGPARPHAMRLASASGGAYEGRMLNWSSRGFTPQVPEAAPAPRAAEQAPVASPPIAYAPPAPRAEPRPAYAPPPRLAAAEAPPMRMAPAPVPAAQAAPRPAAAAPALPDSLYAPPPPSPAPQRLAQAAPPATPASEGSHVRLYSVHRQYGMAPDAIPAPPANASNYVLIGVPSDGAKTDADAEDKPF